VYLEFDGAAGDGDGIGPDSVYYFDDLLEITNQGTRTVYIQVTADADEGDLKVCTSTSTGNMDDECYASVHPAVPVALAAGATLHLGFMLDGTGMDEGDEVVGTFRVVALRSAPE